MSVLQVEERNVYFSFNFDLGETTLNKKNNKIFATISDVAKHANVGKSSVSRFLNGGQSKLSEDLIRRITYAISELDYKPNYSARMLNSGQSKLIGLLLADITNPYSIGVMQGIEQECKKAGYMLMVCNTDNEQKQQDNYLALLEAYRVDGIIINTMGMDDAKLGAFAKIDCPFVLVDRFDSNLDVDSIGLDNQSAMFLGCQHLMEQNYETLLVITQPLTIGPRIERVNAVKEYIKQFSGLKLKMKELTNLEDSPTQAIMDFVSENRGLKKAIITTNGIATLLTAKSLKQLKIHLGSQMGLLSVDDPDWAELVEGGISALRQPTTQIGLEACKRLVNRIEGNGGPALNIKLSAELIVRDSTFG